MAKAVRRFRSALGDTQQQFAIRTGLTVTTIGRYETGWHPKKDVLAKFADIAKENQLPLFAEIFVRDLPPEPVLLQDELMALRSLLYNAVPKLTSNELDVRRGRIALACLSDLQPELLQKLEALLSSRMIPLEQLIEDFSGNIIWNRNVDAEAKYSEFVQNPSLARGSEYAGMVVGEGYRVAFERAWTDAGPQAGIDFLANLRAASGGIGLSHRKKATERVSSAGTRKPGSGS